MQTFIFSFLGGFAGRLFAAAFIAVCILLGFGPDKWAAWMVEVLPAWFTPSMARGIFLTLGLLTFMHIVKPWEWFQTKFLPLEEGARKAYESLGNTQIRRIIQRLNSDDPLGYFKHAFVIDGVRLYAKEPLSTITEKVPHNPEKTWVFRGNDLYSPGDDSPSYVDCMVKWKDVREYIIGIKKRHGEE